ncbi:MAG: VF530 family protein [Verrucomicrobiota bacterium]
MSSQHANDPLHGKTLEAILKVLVDYYGWDTLGRQINIRCFNFDPSIQSSLKFLRKTPWARAKVEDLYLIYTVESTDEKSSEKS